MISLKFAISNACSFCELAPIVRQMQEEISFLGGRYIYVIGYEDCLSLDELSTRVIEIARKTIGFSEEERALAHEIERHVNRIHTESDLRRDSKNLITYTLCIVREFFYKYLVCGGLDSRYLWWMYSLPPSDLFDWYTREQYQQRFGKLPQHRETIAITRNEVQIPLWGPYMPTE